MAAVAQSKPLLPAEHDGHAAFQRHVGDALGGFTAHQVVVARGAANDGAEADYGVVATCLRHLLCSQGGLEGPGHPGDVDILPAHIVPYQAVYGAADQLGGDELVEAGGHDADLDVLRYQFSFEYRHDSSFLGSCLFGQAWGFARTLVAAHRSAVNAPSSPVWCAGRIRHGWLGASEWARVR